MVNLREVNTVPPQLNKPLAKETGRGRVAVGDVAIYTRRDPDTVRGADVVFLSHERYARRRKLEWIEDESDEERSSHFGKST